MFFSPCPAVSIYFLAVMSIFFPGVSPPIDLFPRRCLPGVRLLSRKFSGGRVSIRESGCILHKIKEVKIIFDAAAKVLGTGKKF
jgi:hypothetical protein